MNRKNKLNYYLVIIFLSLIVSLSYANYNFTNFDKNVIDKDNNSVHLMIKNDPLRYFSHGYKIKEDLENGLNYFETGRNNFTKYLYPRIIALYYIIFDYDLYENSNNKIIKKSVHKNFLYIQILFYYLSLIFLYYQIKEKINKKYLFFCLLFLSIEPTLFQYHGSFWSESIFFSLQILIMGLLINSDYSKIKFFSVGIIISLLALQRSNGLYYIIPVVVYLYISKELNYFYRISYLVLGFCLLPAIVSYHNYKISGKFFILPLETKSVLHAYVLPNILSKKELGIEKKNFLKIIDSEKFNNLKIKYNLNEIEYSRYSFIFCENVNNSNKFQNFEICKYFDKRSKEIIISKPIKFLNHVIKKSLSFSILNPFHIYSDHKYLSGEIYYKSELHKKLIPVRISYSLLIYFICLIGLLEMLKKRERNLVIYCLISAIYFFIILSWHGNNRYFTPVLIYLSIFFGYGCSGILDYSKNILKNNK